MGKSQMDVTIVELPSLPSGEEKIGQVGLDALQDRHKRLHVVTGGTPEEYNVQQATATISKKTTIATDFPFRPWKLHRLAATFSAAPTTSENLTLTHNPTGAASRPSDVLLSIDPSATSATSVVKTWEGGQLFRVGDEVTMAYANTDTNTVRIEVTVEIL